MLTGNNVVKSQSKEVCGDISGLPRGRSKSEQTGVISDVETINTGVANKISGAMEATGHGGRRDLQRIEMNFYTALASKGKEGLGTYAKILRNILSDNPNDREAYCKFARLRLMHGSSVLKGLKKAGQRFAEQNNKLAEDLLREAEMYAKIALELEGDDSEPLTVLGGVAFAKGEFELSREYMERVVTVAPEQFDAHATLASIYKADTLRSEGNEKRANKAKAIEHFDLHIRHLWNALNGVNPAVKVADSAVEAYWKKLGKSLELAIKFCDILKSYDDMVKFGLLMAEMLPDKKGNVLELADLLIRKGEFVGARKLAVELMMGCDEGDWIYRQAEGVIKYIKIIEEGANSSAEERKGLFVNGVHAAMESFDYEEAAMIAEKFTDSFPNDPMGEILVMDVDIEACGDARELRQMEKFLADEYEGSRSVDLGYLLAKVLVKNDKYPEAKEVLMEVIETHYLPDAIADAPRELVALWFVVSPLEADDEIFQALLVSGADLLALNAVQANLKERLFRDKERRSGFRNNKFWGQNWKKGAKNLTGYR